MNLIVFVGLILVSAAVDLPFPQLPGATDYLEGRDAEAAQDYRAGAKAYEASAAKSGPLAPYARLRAIRCRALGGQRQQAIGEYESFLAEGEDGPWKALAKTRLAVALMEDARPLRAVPLFKETLAIEPRVWWFDDYEWLEAENAIAHPAVSAHGYAFFRNVVETTPLIVPRFKASTFLATSPDVEDRLLAALGMIRARKYTQGAKLLGAIAPKVITQPSLLSRWTELSGRMLIARGNVSEGRALLDDLARKEKVTPWLPAVLAFTVRTLVTKDRLTDAEKVCQELAKGYPNSFELAEAYWRLGRGYAAANRDERAISSFKEVVNARPESPYADDALIEAGILQRQGGQLEEAQESFRRYIENYPDGNRMAESHFWIGRLFETSGKTGEAEKAYEKARAKGVGDYYAHGAQERLHRIGVSSSRDRPLALGTDESLLRTIPMAKAVPNELPHPGASTDALRRLQFFGLHGLEEGEWEAIHIAQSLPGHSDPGAVYRAMGLGGIAYTAIELANLSGWGKVDGVRSPERYRISYPLAYWPLVVNVSRAFDLDPLLLLSMARKESTYRPALVSFAGATGLMQLMPATATWLADVESTITKEMSGRLTEPVNSLYMGAAYLKRMLDRSDRNLIYALASYNAGPGNLDKWRRRFGDLPPVDFIERIPFSETRGYIKAVLANYAAYYSLYPPYQDMVDTPITR